MTFSFAQLQVLLWGSVALAALLACVFLVEMIVHRKSIEHWAWLHRMALLGLGASIGLYHLAEKGRCDAVGAFLVIAGPLCGWISERGHRRTATDRDRDREEDERVHEIEAIHGSTNSGWNFGPLPPPLGGDPWGGPGGTPPAKIPFPPKN